MSLTGVAAILNIVDSNSRKDLFQPALNWQTTPTERFLNWSNVKQVQIEQIITLN